MKPEPDAWHWENEEAGFEGASLVNGYKDSDTIVNTPLWSAETNREVIERKFEELHDKIRETERPVPYPVYEKIEETKEEILQVFDQ